MVNPIQRR